MLDVVAGEIGVGEPAHGYEDRCCFVVVVQGDLRCAVADVDDMADDTLLFTPGDFDPVSDLDRVLGETERY